MLYILYNVIIFSYHKTVLVFRFNQEEYSAEHSFLYIIILTFDRVFILDSESAMDHGVKFGEM